MHIQSNNFKAWQILCVMAMSSDAGSISPGTLPKRKRLSRAVELADSAAGLQKGETTIAFWKAANSVDCKR